MDADGYGCLCLCMLMCVEMLVRVKMLVCMKVSEESCSLSVLADGYERKDKIAGRIPPSYTQDLHSLGL